MIRGILQLRCNGGLLQGTIEGEIMLLEKTDIQFTPAKERFGKLMVK